MPGGGSTRPHAKLRTHPVKHQGGHKTGDKGFDVRHHVLSQVTHIKRMTLYMAAKRRSRSCARVRPWGGRVGALLPEWVFCMILTAASIAPGALQNASFVLWEGGFAIPQCQ